MLIWLAVILGVVFLDQLTKYLAIFFLKGEPSVPILEGVLQLTYVENPGAAFGMMKDQRWLFMVTSVVAILAMLAYLLIKRPKSRLECLAIAFIVGGGIGNMIDRTLIGYVVDMIDFCLIDFAVFNVADSFVCVGAGLLMLWMIRSMIEEAKADKAKRLAAAEGEEAPEGEAPEGEEVPEGEVPEGEEVPEAEVAEGEEAPEGEVAEGEMPAEGTEPAGREAPAGADNADDAAVSSAAEGSAADTADAAPAEEGDHV